MVKAETIPTGHLDKTKYPKVAALSTRPGRCPPPAGTFLSSFNANRHYARI
jgi:hypothetical protein